MSNRLRIYMNLNDIMKLGKLPLFNVMNNL